MDTVQDFEDLLALLERFGVRYLIVGGLAFIRYATRTPRCPGTKSSTTSAGPIRSKLHRLQV